MSFEGCNAAGGRSRPNKSRVLRRLCWRPPSRGVSDFDFGSLASFSEEALALSFEVEFRSGEDEDFLPRSSQLLERDLFLFLCLGVALTVLCLALARLLSDLFRCLLVDFFGGGVFSRFFFLEFCDSIERLTLLDHRSLESSRS